MTAPEELPLSLVLFNSKSLLYGPLESNAVARGYFHGELSVESTWLVWSISEAGEMADLYYSCSRLADCTPPQLVHSDKFSSLRLETVATEWSPFLNQQKHFHLFQTLQDLELSMLTLNGQNKVCVLTRRVFALPY